MTVQIPQDIYDYEPKLFGHMTGRQVICFVAGFAVIFGVTALLYVPLHDISIAGLLAFLAGLPIIMCGVIKQHGLHLERVLALKIRDAKRPKYRPFRMHNFYEDIETAGEEMIAFEKAEFEKAEKENGSTQE